jgi:hypothetical protein
MAPGSSAVNGLPSPWVIRRTSWLSRILFCSVRLRVSHARLSDSASICSTDLAAERKCMSCALRAWNRASSELPIAMICGASVQGHDEGRVQGCKGMTREGSKGARA